MSIQQAFNYVGISETISTSGLPTIDQLSGLAAEGYGIVINLLPDDSEYAVAGERQAVELQGLDYVYIPVDYSEPKLADFEVFEATMASLGERKAYIHCAANYRVSVFYGVFACRAGLWTKEKMYEHIFSLFKPDEYPPWPEFIEQMVSSRC